MEMLDYFKGFHMVELASRDAEIWHLGTDMQWRLMFFLRTNKNLIPKKLRRRTKLFFGIQKKSTFSISQFGHQFFFLVTKVYLCQQVNYILVTSGLIAIASF